MASLVLFSKKCVFAPDEIIIFYGDNQKMRKHEFFKCSEPDLKNKILNNEKREKLMFQISILVKKKQTKKNVCSRHRR